MKFSFIHVEKAHFPVAALCRLLGVTRQGYYAFVKRGPSQRDRAERVLQAQVQRVFTESSARYGSPRVHEQLQREGLRVGKGRVERAMRGLGLVAQGPRRRQTTTTTDPSHTVASNVLARDFQATRPDTRWVTDITYVWTDEGWSYLAVLLDLFSRAVVGWALDTTLSTSLVLKALDMGLRRRRPSAGLLHHSDRGCQYTSKDYRATLAAHGIAVSMSRKGNCWDNAVAESFFATLKRELIHARPWRTRAELRAAVFEYIEIFYNRRRLHSSLGYKTPVEVERDHLHAAAA